MATIVISLFKTIIEEGRDTLGGERKTENGNIETREKAISSDMIAPPQIPIVFFFGKILEFI